MCLGVQFNVTSLPGAQPRKLLVWLLEEPMSQCHESCLVGWPGRVWGGLGEIFMFKAELRIYSSGHTLLKTLLNGANSLTPLTSLVCSVSMWGGEK